MSFPTRLFLSPTGHSSVTKLWRPAAAVLRALGPYGAIELVVPGGSLVVLSLWAIRHRSSLAAWVRHTFARRA